MDIQASDRKKNFKQGEKTSGMLNVELILHFKLRPAGWAGNDRSIIQGPLRAFIKIIRAFANSSWVLMGDESVSFSARWHRHGGAFNKIDISE